MFQHMNHGPAFQALWKQLRTEVRNLQDRGYYGDGPSFSPAPWLHRLSSHQGYWSAGTRLADSAKVAGEGIDPGDLPEYMVRRSSILSLTSTFHLSYFSVGELKHALVRQRRVVGVLAGVAMLCPRIIQAAKPRKGEKAGVESLRSMPSRAKAYP